MKYFTLILLIMTLFTGNAFAFNTNDSMTVGFVGEKPFVIKTEQNSVKGLSVDLWDEVAKDNNIKYDYLVFDSVDFALKQLESGKVGVVVGPVSITSERHKHVQFTQPYYKAGISIMAPSKAASFVEQVKGISVGVFAIVFSKTFGLGLLALTFVVFLFGIAIWLAEKNYNSKEFPKQFAPGLGVAAYYVWVVMTTTGLGDKYCKTRSGRIITSLLMLFSYISLPILTGFAAAFTTISLGENTSIQTSEDLDNKNIAVIEGSSSIPFVKENNGRIIKVKNAQDAIKLINDDAVSAFVYDKPVLSYMVHNGLAEGMAVSSATYNIQGYGFAVSKSELQNKLSLSILKITESSLMLNIEQKWLGK